jgi:hypothetical protein
MKGQESRHPRECIQRSVFGQVFTDVVHDGIDTLYVKILLSKSGRHDFCSSVSERQRESQKVLKASVDQKYTFTYFTTSCDPLYNRQVYSLSPAIGASG